MSPFPLDGLQSFKEPEAADNDSLLDSMLDESDLPDENSISFHIGVIFIKISEFAPPPLFCLEMFT